jgi:hypothetical protein
VLRGGLLEISIIKHVSFFQGSKHLPVSIEAGHETEVQGAKEEKTGHHTYISIAGL